MKLPVNFGAPVPMSQQDSDQGRSSAPALVTVLLRHWKLTMKYR